MPLVELRENEHFFITVLRSFDFLRKLGYSNGEFLLYFREISISYVSQKLKRQVAICWSDRQTLDVEISSLKFDIFSRKKEKPFMLSDLYFRYENGFLIEKIDAKNYERLVKENALFVEKELSEVIKGLKWI